MLEGPADAIFSSAGLIELAAQFDIPEERMKRLHFIVFVVAVIYGYEAKPSGTEQQPPNASPPEQQGLTTQAANEAERKAEIAEVTARTRREHPEWSQQRVDEN